MRRFILQCHRGSTAVVGEWHATQDEALAALVHALSADAWDAIAFTMLPPGDVPQPRYGKLGIASGWLQRTRKGEPET